MKRLHPEFFQRMVDEALIGFIAFSEETHSCVFANHVAMSLLDWPTTEDIYLRRVSDLQPLKQEKRLTCFSEQLLSNEGLYQEVLLQKRSGYYLVSNLGVKHFQADSDRYILLMIQDITLQKKLQREVMEKQAEIHRALEDLKGQNRQLRELDLAKNKFIALTTHELRTPLSAMVASAEVLQMGLYDSPEEMKKFVDLLVEQGKHLTRLVNDVLDFAKIQAGKMDYYIERQDIMGLMKSRCGNFQSMAEYAEVDLTFEASGAEKLECYFDYLRLQQVIDNMITNAIKYNHPGGKVKLMIKDTPDWVLVFVEDTGRGIAEDYLEKVFDEFETLGQVSQHHQGTGLGMPISKRMIEAMGGSIHVQSELDTGSTFWLEVPKHKVLEEETYRSRSSKKAA